MTRISKFLRATALLAAAGLAACAAPFNGPQDVSDERLMFPITVAPHMETLRVPFSGSGWDVPPDMSGRLAAFTKDYLENGNGAISVTVPNGDESARRYFASRLSELGVPAWRIMIGASDAPSADNSVELSFIRYAAEVAPCGDWSSNAADTASNMPMPNMGCASQHNLAAMVADPRDLVAPRGQDAADAQRRMTVLDKYRKGDSTPAETTAAQSGAVSEVNKQ
jgi:pilus assembly protein CpaD